MNEHVAAPPTATPIGLSAVAGAINGPWAALNTVWEGMRAEFGIKLRFDVEAERKGYVLEAVEITHGRGLLRIFATRLINAGLVSADFESALDAVLGASAFTVQAYVNGQFLPRSLGVANRRMILAANRVCRIEIDSDHQGTGVLVRSTLVATAAHVIEPLMLPLPADAPTGAQRQGAPDALKRLKLVFGDVEDLLDETRGQVRRRTGVTASLHQQWLAYHSPATQNELSKNLFDIDNIDGITVPNGPWDLAVIRLAAPPRPGATGQDLLPTEPPRKPFELHVFHHPGTVYRGRVNPILWSIGIMDRGLGEPIVRRLHTANTDGGSSGAPCFDRDFRIVALHQAGPRRPGEDARNRAVPIQYWRDKLDALESEAEIPYRKFIELPDVGQQPVIGRRETQRRIWRASGAAAMASERLLVIRGEPGQGTRFTEHLVRAFAADDGSIVGTLDLANAQGTDAVGFATRIVGAFGTKFADRVRASGLTTDLRDVKDEVLPALLTELRQLTPDGQPIWLVLHGFDAPKTVLSLIETLMTRLSEIPQLRLVLAGWKWTLAPQFLSSVEELKPPSAEDVVDHLALRFLPPGAVLEDEKRATLLGASKLELSAINLRAADVYPRLLEIVTPMPAKAVQLLRPVAPGG
jgi:hypothetical protein